MKLECSKLTAGYRDMVIISDVSIAINQGSITTIIGPNGAGKSTFLKALMGLARIHGGDIMVDEQSIMPIRTEQMVNLGIGYVPQMANVFPTLTVAENLEIGSYARARGSLENVLSLFDALKPVLKKPAGRLSGGQQTMVAVGRALMSGPDILLVDEPTAGLSPVIAGTLWGYLRRLADQGMGIGVVEQNVHLALTNSDDAYLLASGSVRLHESASELAAREDLEGLFMESELQEQN